jgi:hypothetical protein
MDLLTLFGSSVAAAAAGKAVGTWAVWRPFGGSTTFNSLRRRARLDAVAEFSAPTIVTIALTWVLSVRGRKGFGREREREGGEKMCPQCWCR